MKELSIFVDESGDFGKCDKSCPFYIVALVFHEQKNKILGQVEKLNSVLEMYDLNNHAIHTAPLIRRELDYKDYRIDFRHKIFHNLFKFSSEVKISQTALVVDKRQVSGQFGIMRKINSQLYYLLQKHQDYFLGFDKIVIYYDNGQYQLSLLLVTIFEILFGNKCEFRQVFPKDYKLFQTADLICTLTLLKAKLKDGKGLTNSELMFFGNVRKLKKNYLKFLDRIEFE